MSEKEESWEKKMKAMLDARLKPLEESLGSVSSELTSLRERQPSLPSSDGEKTDVPLYKCKNGKCGFATDDLDAYLDHKHGHYHEEETPPAPRKRHETVDEFLSCPECRPRFDKRYVEEGWTPPKKEPEKKPEKGSGLGI